MSYDSHNVLESLVSEPLAIVGAVTASAAGRTVSHLFFYHNHHHNHHQHSRRRHHMGISWQLLLIFLLSVLEVPVFLILCM